MVQYQGLPWCNTRDSHGAIPDQHGATDTAGAPVSPDMARRNSVFHNCDESKNKSLPWNFSWLEPGVLAGSGVPEGFWELEAMVREGVSHLVSLPAESYSAPPAPPRTPVKGLTIHFIPMRDFEGPSMDQMEEFLHICEVAKAAGEGVAVHCRGGNGRTGTMLAVYLVWSRGMEARAAVEEVRRTRPGSIEFKEQMEAVLSYQATRLMNIQHFQKLEI